MAAVSSSIPVEEPSRQCVPLGPVDLQLTTWRCTAPARVTGKRVRDRGCISAFSFCLELTAAEVRHSASVPHIIAVDGRRL
jgi:hypothetical protein